MTGSTLTPADTAAALALNISASAHVETALHSTIIQGSRASNIVIHQHFQNVEFAEMLI